MLVLILVMGFVGLRHDSSGRVYMNIVEASCALFLFYVFFTFALLLMLLRIPAFERWVFKHLGEDRVRRLVYN